MERTLDRLPISLSRYCSEHDVGKYAPRDHAAWRYIMRRARDFFSEHAVSTYRDGFALSGLKIDRIPHIDEIDRALQSFGWGAVPVVGFIPPWAFIEFQARKILPIATDMRTVEHIGYTPAPDIVHEAAGHAPILPDHAYSEYLSYYASLGTKAIYSRQDLRLYEAVRYLSDVKEKPESTPAIIADAEAKLKAAVGAFSFVSEQALVARMSWWTAEYGLVGSLAQPKIYGAGLLSSVGESKLAMSTRVKKIPFSIDCINYSYNITEPQPQLFVAESMQHLHDVLHELDATLSYRVGGLASLEKALQCEAVTTTCFETGLGISGRLVAFEHAGDRIDFVKYAGPVQLSFEGQELAGHGIARHADGFSSPLGRLSAFPDRAFSHLPREALDSLGLTIGHEVVLRYVSGFEVKGRLLRFERRQGRNLGMSFAHCTVRRGDQVFFEPSWGEFDLILGDRIPSVYGGPADRDLFGEHEIAEATSTPGRETPYTPREQELFLHYQSLHNLRDQTQESSEGAWASHLQKLAELAYKEYPDEWLFFLELIEVIEGKLPPGTAQETWVKNVRLALHRLRGYGDSDRRELIDEGLLLLTRR